MKVALFGKVEFDSYSGELTMLHPEFEISPATTRTAMPRCTSAAWCPFTKPRGKVTTRVLRTLMHRILQERRRRWRIRCPRYPARAAETAGPLDGASARCISRRRTPTCAC